MILSRTPLRISFAGGGTDIPSFYRDEPGAVVSTSIDKYIYITANKYFDDRIILKYSKTEEVGRVRQIRHPLLRESLKMAGITRGIEITSMADVVGGTGLGSSSSFTVGVMHALHAFAGRFVPVEKLAREACEIEIDRVKEPIGKQDHYIAAYGGLQFIEFMPDEEVRVSPIICPRHKLQDLAKHLMLYYTGKTRKSRDILSRLSARHKTNKIDLRQMRSLADSARKELQAGRIDDFGLILHEGWLLKKGLVEGISNPEFDAVYDRARKHGASGGKILGAGGGGFLLLFAAPDKQDSVRAAMKGWREIPFNFEPAGSKIVYTSR